MAIDLLPDQLWAEAKGNARVPRRGASARRPQPIRHGVGLLDQRVSPPRSAQLSDLAPSHGC